jgi:hypothetical protein
MDKLWAFFATSFRHVTCQDVFGSIKISMPELPTAFAILAFRATQNMVYTKTLVQSMVESCSVHQQALALMTVAAGPEFVNDIHSGIMMLGEAMSKTTLRCRSVAKPC